MIPLLMPLMTTEKMGKEELFNQEKVVVEVEQTILQIDLRL